MLSYDLLAQFQQEAQAFPHLCQKRPEESHKGTFGTLAILGGQKGMAGAVVLASSAALMQGCGKVWAGFLQDSLPMPIIPQQPEIMLATCQTLQSQWVDFSAIVCGCGLGQSDEAQAHLKALLETAPCPLLLDADALNLLAKYPELARLAQAYAQPLILTPHPAEAARLLGNTTQDIQQNRLAAIKALCQQYRAVIVLKGHLSLIQSPDSEIFENHSGSPALATAGSGDVLSGTIGSLIAQGLPILEAARAGAWLHGAAAQWLAEQGIGEIGLTASEIAPAARWLRNHITQSMAHQEH